MDDPTCRPGVLAVHCERPARLDAHGCVRCSVCNLAAEVTGTIVNTSLTTTAFGATLRLDPASGWLQLAPPMELHDGRITRWYRAVEAPPAIGLRDVGPFFGNNSRG